MKKVSLLQVKRSFVTANFLREPRKGERYLGQLPKKEFIKKLEAAKRKSLKLSEKQLNIRISGEWRKRLRAYNASDWSLVTMKVTHLGVWRGAGGLPREWTAGSLKETAQKVAKGLVENSPLIRRRAKHAIPSMLAENIPDLQKEPLLFPIVFQHGTGTNGRKGLVKKLAGDVDDGCMRSIALALSGRKTITVYFGTPKKKNTRLL